MTIPALLKGRLALPVIGSPLFIVSVPELVIAQCKAGIVGSFPALNARPKEKLEDWIVQVKTELAAYQAAHPDAIVAPFAVNQIAHHCNRFQVPPPAELAPLLSEIRSLLNAAWSRTGG